MKENHITRRNFLKTSCIGSLTAMGTGIFPLETISAVNDAEPMKITKIEAVRFRQGGFIPIDSDEPEETIYFRSRKDRFYTV